MSSNETEKYLHELKINELQDELDKRDLEKSGVKATLIDRLEQALKSEGHDAQNYKFVVHGLHNQSNKKDDSDGKTRSNTTDAAEDGDSRKMEPIEQQSKNSNELRKETSNNKDEYYEHESNSSVEKTATTKLIKQEDCEIIEMDHSTKNRNKEAECKPIQQNVSMPDLISISTSSSDGKNSKQETERDTATNKKLQPQKSVTAQKDLLASSLWVRNITTATKAADLKTLFSKHGKVITAKIFTTKNKQSPTCFGYITLADTETAELCVEKLNRLNFKGRVISVEKADRSNLSQISKPTSTPLTRDQQEADKALTSNKSSDAKPTDTIENLAKKLKTSATQKESTTASSDSKKPTRPRIKPEPAREITKESPSKWRTPYYSSRDRYDPRKQPRMSSYTRTTMAPYERNAPVVANQYPARRVIQTSRGVRVTTSNLHHYKSQLPRTNEPNIDHRNLHHSMSRRSHSPSDKDEMLRIMRRREEEHRKKEEELRIEKEREKLKYEREKLEREKLELETYKLQAQLAQATQLAAGIPLAAPASGLIGSNSAVQHLISQYQRIDTSHQRKESSKDDHKTAPRHQSKERETTKSQHNRHDHDSLSRMSNSHDRDRRGRLTDNRSNNSRTKSNRSRSPLHRNEASRGNDRRASQISNKDSRISKYGQRNEDPHQKRANRGGPSEMTTDRTMGTSQPFITGHYNKRSYYADDGTNIDNRNYSTERQHPLIHSPPDHGTHRKISPQPRAREIFPNDRFGSEMNAESYMVRTDPSYASRISQAQQPISRPTDMAFGNNPFGMNTNQQRGGTNYTQTQYGREPPSNSHGFLQNSNWDTSNRGAAFANTNPNPWNVSEGNWNLYAGTSTNQQGSTSGERMQQSYGKGQGSSYTAGRRY